MVEPLALSPSPRRVALRRPAGSHGSLWLSPAGTAVRQYGLYVRQSISLWLSPAGTFAVAACGAQAAGCDV